ncbi:hypothetical protein J6590_100675, partial [Homalodisca vitripennis]
MSNNFTPESLASWEGKRGHMVARKFTSVKGRKISKRYNGVHNGLENNKRIRYSESYEGKVQLQAAIKVLQWAATWLSRREWIHNEL